MRYYISSARRHRAGLRATARVLGLAGAAVLASGCSWITGVPDVERVRVTLSRPDAVAEGSGVPIIGEAFDKSGGIVNHRRRIVQFSSSDPTVATVAGSGTNATVLGIKPGTAWIVGKSQDKKDSALITVTPPLPARIVLDPEFPRVAVGGSTRVTVRALNTAGQLLSNYTVLCQSSVPTLMTANTSGTTCELRGIAPGTATLNVRINGVANENFSVPVENEVPARVVPTVRSPLREGEQVNVDVELRRADGSSIPIAGRNFSYQTSNPAVFTVSGAGLLTTTGEGTATLTVRDGNVSGTQQITVTKIRVEEVVLPQNPIFRVGVLGSIIPVAFDSAQPPRALALTRRKVEYRPADSTVLRISSAGIVTPLKVGTTEITVTVDSITRRTTATVTPVPVGRVIIDSSQVERNPGGTFQYTATVFDSLNNRLTDRAIRWSSNSPGIVTINASTGLARAVQPGRVTISAFVVRVPNFPGEVPGEAEFTVLATPVARVEVAPATVSVRAGGSTNVAIIVRDAANNQLFGRAVRPVSENPAVATATSDGTNAIIRGVTAGSTTIRFQALTPGDQPEGEAGVLQVTVTAGGVVNVVRPAPRP
jgi:uncharacterized protein YjdB